MGISSVINNVLNKNNTKAVVLVMSVFVFYLIFEQIIEITKMVIEYNASYDYGRHLKKTCGDEFVEAETSRFYISSNAEKLQLSNNRNKYMIVVLVIAIIVAVVISLILSFITYNTFINLDQIHMMTDKKFEDFLGKISSTSTLTENVKNGYLYVVYAIKNVLFDPILDLRKIIVYMFITRSNGSSMFYNFILLLMMALMYACTIAIFVLMPIYIGLKLSNKSDISPFNKDYKVFVPYIVLFVVILMLKLFYLYFKADSALAFNPITQYFSSNVKNLHVSNEVSGFIVFMACMAVYICMFYILGNVIHHYEKSKRDRVDEEEETNVNVRQNIFTRFINDTFGFSEYNNFESKHLLVKNISGIVLTILIIVAVIAVVLWVTHLFGTNENNTNIIRYGLIAPLVVLVVVMFSTNSVSSFNASINEYVIQQPDSLYKQYIGILNNIFNTLIENEYSEKNTKGNYVCRNSGNAILLTVYSNLFNKLSTVKRNGNEEGPEQFIDMTPSFVYDKNCSDDKAFDFGSLPEYDASYYLNGKQTQKSIFYKSTKCQTINDKVLEQLFANINVFTEREQEMVFAEIQKTKDSSGRRMMQSQESLDKNPVQTTKSVVRALGKSIRTKLDNRQEKVRKQLYRSLQNVAERNTYHDSSKKIIYSNANKSFYGDDSVCGDLNNNDIHLHNNLLTDLAPTGKATGAMVFYNDIVEEISDIYMEILYGYLYAHTRIHSKTTEDHNQDEFVKFFSNHVKDCFAKMNKVLSSPAKALNKNTLTRYVINNYNNIHTSDTYKKNVFDVIQPNRRKIETTKDMMQDVEIYSDYLSKLSDVFESIQALVKDLKANNHSNLGFITRFQRASFLSGSYIEEFEKYKNDIPFQRNINSMMRDNENLYILMFNMQSVNGTVNEKNVKREIYHITYEMFILCKALLDDVSKRNAILVKKKHEKDDFKMVAKHDDIIKSYTDILNKNIGNLSNDYESFLLGANNRSAGYVLEGFSKDLSLNYTKDAYASQRLIYLVIMNYIAVFVLSNVIIL